MAHRLIKTGVLVAALVVDFAGCRPSAAENAATAKAATEKAAAAKATAEAATKAAAEQAIAEIQKLGGTVNRDEDSPGGPVSEVYFSNLATDAGLVHLRALPQLRTLYLFQCTQITDAGLVHLKGLTQLHGLSLDHTKVTEEGVKNCQQALPNCKIEWTPPKPDERQSPAKPDQPDG